jgi:hypothetical protein
MLNSFAIFDYRLKNDWTKLQLNWQFLARKSPIYASKQGFTQFYEKNPNESGLLFNDFFSDNTPQY